MPVSYDCTLSLIERKKLQWAKEKELAVLDKQWSISEEPVDRISRQIRRRRSSLPPLNKNQYNSCGETSGYGSDNPNHSPDWNPQSGYESSSSRDDRMKWDNKNKLWQTKEETFDKHGINEPPNWVKRGLKGEEIVINNTSPAESPEQRCEDERPQTGSSFSQNRNTYLRGQNIPIDSEELAERERRRQAALAHQNAIRRQLEERERKRQEDKKRKIREEKEEELRIERDQEIEKKRREEEHKLLQVKLEREKKRKEIIEEAIELAQKEAQLAKSNKNKQNNINNDLKIENDEKLNNDFNNNNNNNNNLEIKGKSISSPRKIKNSSPKLPPQTTPKSDNNVNFIIPGTIENYQYALLIPTVQFKENKKFCDNSTQTEESILSRSESIQENRKEKSSLEDRPKWGVNKPPTRYIKQSEKDLLYQKRKFRLKSRDDKNSSDESQMGSPRMMYRKKGHIDKRYSRYQSEIVPLETIQDRICYKKHVCCCFCRCSRHSCRSNVDVLTIDHREKSIKTLDDIDKLPELDNMEKLNLLRNGLIFKQEQWGDVTLQSPRVSIN